MEVANALYVVEIAAELPQEAVQALCGSIVFAWNICVCEPSPPGNCNWGVVPGREEIRMFIKTNVGCQLCSSSGLNLSCESSEVLRSSPREPNAFLVASSRL